VEAVGEESRLSRAEKRTAKIDQKGKQIMTLNDAITQAETAGAAYSNASAQITTDQSFEAGIQAKLDAAKATVSADLAAQASAATAFNAALDALIQAATGAKIPAAA
jgi:NAD/NADP transhydrogenase alpha subunit